MAINRVYETGKIMGEIKKKMHEDGYTIVNFRISVPYGFGANKRMDFFECNAYRQTADYIASNAKDGTMVTIEGHLRQRRWLEGEVQRSTVVIDVDDVVLGKIE